MMRRLWLLALLQLASCVSQSSLDGFPIADWEPGEAVFFIERQPADTHRLDEAIVRHLARRGVTAVTEEPDRYDYRLTYVDRWYWDMRMYMIDFRIDVRDPETNVLLATARSFQTSLAALGRGREEIIGNTIAILFDGREVQPPPGVTRGKSPRH